jgi:hypothetical protein
MKKAQYVQIAALVLIILGSFSFASKSIISQSAPLLLAQVVNLDTDPTLVGRWATAQTFNGTTDNVLTSQDYIGTGPVTITAWITPRSWGGANSGRIVDNDSFDFAVRGNGAQIEARNTGNTLSASADSSITLNTKQFVAVSRNGTALTFYVNGVASGNVNVNDAPVAGRNNMYIGNRRGFDAGFDGTIEDLRVYSRILQPTEIASLAGTQAPPPSTYTLTASKSGNGTGTVTGGNISCGSTCTQTSISSGASITLNATPAADSTFAGWSGGGCSGTGSCTVSVNSNTTVTATFNLTAAPPPSTFSLTVSKSGTGTGTVTGGSISCGSTCSQTGITSGTSITLSASAASGSIFVGWGGACSGTGSCSVTMNANTTVTATFNSTAPAPTGCAAANVKCVPSEYSSIQACADAAVSGDTCFVTGGVYGNRLGVSKSNITFKADPSGTQPKLVGASISGDNIILDGFEITHDLPTTDGGKSIIARGNYIQIINNYFHHTMADCVNIGGTHNIIRGNTVTLCRAQSAVSAHTPATITITSSNNAIRFSTDQMAARTIIIPSGTYVTDPNSSAGSKIKDQINAQINASGGGALAEWDYTLQIVSNTNGPKSKITLEAVANSAYAAIGLSIGDGSMQGQDGAFQIETGSNNLVENNKAYYLGDYVTTGVNSNRLVIRNNIWGPSGNVSVRHIDGYQPSSGALVLYENNRSTDNNNDNNHMALFQYHDSNTIIMRYNSSFNSPPAVDCTRGAWSAGYGGANTTDPGVMYYNNSLVDSKPIFGPNDSILYCKTSLNNIARNNIFYNATTIHPYKATDDEAPTSINKDYDLWFNNGSLAFEANDVNADPLFRSRTTGDYTLLSGSPAIDKGGHLTTATTAGSGTTLQVAYSAMFQDGWAGVIPDEIAVGSPTNHARISSINYATHTITLASPLAAWSAGAPVYLYAKSDGTQVLYGSAPDMGAYEYNSGGVVNPPPTNRPGDFNNDGFVNTIDYSLLVGAWNTNNATYDLNHDGTVNTLDYSIMARNWTN